MQIKGTFLDEISHDIPHQNWGEKEWDADFGHMHRAGIEHVILIRCGYRRWQTFSSQYDGQLKGIETMSLPSTRSFGFNLNVTL